jgi:hypothetical protein
LRLGPELGGEPSFRKKTKLFKDQQVGNAELEPPKKK